MKALGYCVLLMVLLAGRHITAQTGASADASEESAHRQGPHGLEGWTLKSSIPDRPGETYSFTLVLARRGQIVQRISGDPLVWRWMFWAAGRQVAYESGPLHFDLACVLADISTGHELARYD